MLALQNASALFATLIGQAQTQAALSFSSGLWLPIHALLAAGLLWMPARPLRDRERLYIVLDSLIIILASSLVFYLLLRPTVAAEVALEPATRNSVIAASWTSLLLFCIALMWSLRDAGAGQTPPGSIALNIALIACANALSSAAILSAEAGLGLLSQILTAVSLFGLALAALRQANAAQPVTPTAEPSLRIQWTRYLPLICAEVAFLMPVVYVSRTGPAGEGDVFLALSVVVAIVIGLTLLRVGITLRDNYQLSVEMALTAQRHQQNAESLRRLKEELEQRVLERTAEIREVNEALKREIAERRQAQAEIEAQRAFLQHVIDLNPNRIYARDASGHFTLVNRAMAEATGHTTREMLGKTELELNPRLPDAERFLREDYEILRSRREEVIAEQQTMDRFGRPIWLYTVKRPIVDDAGQAQQLLGVSVDITQRKLAEDRLRLNEQRLRLVTDNMIDLVSQIDLNHIIQYASPSHRWVLNYEPQELMGRPIFDFLHPDEAGEILSSLRQLLAEREPQRRRLRVRHADGRWIWIEAIGKTLRDERNQISGLIISARDITATRQAEEALSQAHHNLSIAYQATLEGWMRALDLRDTSTEGHSQRVSELTVRIARAMQVPEDQLEHIRRGALLHDIGKMGVPDAILRKPGPLNEEETAIMRKHVDYARDILWHIPYLRPALDIPYCHHERWDGSGYPRGLRGEEIPLAARIFAVVDVWDALLSERPYRPAWPVRQALDYIRAGAGSAFDPTVVAVFFDLWERGEIAAPAVPADGCAIPRLRIAQDAARSG